LIDDMLEISTGQSSDLRRSRTWRQHLSGIATATNPADAAGFVGKRYGV
jgi:hypothetical protein